MLGEIGTLAWTRRTNGRLSTRDWIRYVAAAAAVQARAAGPLVAFRLGRAVGRQARIGEEDLRVPDSKLARETVEACRAAQPATVVEHCYRSFIFARALGSLAGVAHDEELLFVATMFHDAGAMEVDRSDGGRCFTLNSAAAADTHLERAGWGRERRDLVSEAITLHLNPPGPVERGSEAHLMHDGVLLDAVCLGAWRFRREGLDLVRARHPRLRFSQEGGRLLSQQARGIPRCRVAAAMRAGFGLALKLGAWQD